MSDQYRYVLVAWDGDDDQRTDVLDRNQVVDRGPLKQGQKVKAKWRGTNYSATVLAWDASKENMMEGAPKHDLACQKYSGGVTKKPEDECVPRTDVKIAKRSVKATPKAMASLTSKAGNQVKQVTKKTQSKSTKNPEALDLHRSTPCSPKKKKTKSRCEESTSCEESDEKSTRRPKALDRRSAPHSPKKKKAKSRCEESTSCEESDEISTKRLETLEVHRSTPHTPKRKRAQSRYHEENTSCEGSDEDESQQTQKRKKRKMNDSLEDPAVEEIPTPRKKHPPTVQRRLEEVERVVQMSPPQPLALHSLCKDVALLRQEVQDLQKTQSKFQKRLSQQGRSLFELRHQESRSSASEFERTRTRSPTPLSPRFSGHPAPRIKEEGIADLDGVDQLRLATAKVQSEPGAAALKMLDALFTTEELVNGNPSGVTNSKDPSRQGSIKKLDPVRMKYIYDFLESKWPGASTDKTVRRKMTQKCTDYYNDSRHRYLRK